MDTSLKRLRALKSEFPPILLPNRCRCPTPLRDQFPFLLRKRCVNVQHELIAISSKCGDDKVHAVLHQATYEVHVAGQTVEPRDDERTSGRLCGFQCRCKSRSQQQRICSRPGLHILMPGRDSEPFALTKDFDLVTLCL